MKRILIKVLVFVFIVGGLAAVLWPVDNWRMYDANWKPLAMTDAEGYCAGYLLGESGFNNSQDVEAMAACITTNDQKDNTTPNVGIVIRSFCNGISLTAGMPQQDCEDIIEGYEIWPLMNGGYTWEWNDTNARPQVVQSNISQAPRRDGRTDDIRNETGRLGE